MRTLLLAAGLLALPALALAQGTLTPPGAPAPSMKTLDQIEARSPLQSGVPGVAQNANGGFTLLEPGSYYLTRNLSVASGTAIQIFADNVTLDLNGFTINSTASPANGSAIGIVNNQNIVIRNGHINGSIQFDLVTGAPYGSGFKTGIVGPPTNELVCRVSDITIRGVLNSGIDLGAGGGSTVERCDVYGCSVGISAGFVSNSNARASVLNGIDAINVTNCFGSSRDANGCGIRAGGTATSCRATNSASGGIALGAQIAIGCTVDQGSILTVNRYLMP